MTREEAEEFGRRALAAGFEWSDGGACTCCVGRHSRTTPRWKRPPCPPDFRDAATLGILVAQVRERYGDPGLHVTCGLDGDGREEWVVWAVVDDYTGARDGIVAEPTELEALVAALEAAPP